MSQSLLGQGGVEIEDPRHSPEVQIEVNQLTKLFRQGERAAVNGISFTLHKGDILALLGPSGCGKTTTLRMIAGFEQPDSGQILLQGQDVTRLSPQARKIGFVFQDYALFPHMTIAQNVAFAMRHLAKRERPAKTRYWLELMGLQGLENRYPNELSGGQQQRVALARTLAAEPDLVLLDEPFSNLDASLRETTRNEMRALFKRSGTTVILVTHDQAEALTFADQVGVMNAGRLEQLDTPQHVYQYPSNAFVARFLGHTNLLYGDADNGLVKTALGDLQIEPGVVGQVRLSLRPEDLHLSPAPTCDAAARVISREFRGHDYFYTLEQDGVQYCVIAPSHHCFDVGSWVNINVLRGGSVLPH
ncbi:ABC transporter ATP-binding protein [Nitrincola tapanii]|uniref:ABC transporter ATP-binding protein n=1 Tax=Nitrincola tapanii TaxID=1708751 RepID=A0A5A9W5V5_9GAMM|nr:ABC transporter ATP-binding protein [Nitrincola tapanii]KAA0875488.1 ABC transporter ATP-binding protein [Nitrincola tapanii]